MPTFGFNLGRMSAMRSSFSSLTPLDTPTRTTTSHEDQLTANGAATSDPCSFMPQTPTPMMLMFARRKQDDDNATNLWMQDSDSNPARFSNRCKNLTHSTLDAHSVDDGGDIYRYANHSDDVDRDSAASSSLDSEPHTPPTPSSTASFGSRLSQKLHTYFRTPTHTSKVGAAFKYCASTAVLLLFAFLILVVMAIIAKIRATIGCVTWAPEKRSERLEIGLECVGFVAGRAVARLGRGFVKGYNVE